MIGNNLEKTDFVRPHEEFLRQVVFFKDADNILAVFPFFHDINDRDFARLSEEFFEDEETPKKKEFCLMHATHFGWGWISKNLLPKLELAEYDEYEDEMNKLIDMRAIKPSFVLNLD